MAFIHITEYNTAEEKRGDFIFTVANILAASIDGFISGFAIAASGAEYTRKDFIRTFRIIFMCCISASCAGKGIAAFYTEKYLDTFSIAAMLYLSYSAFTEDMTSASIPHNLYTVAFSVAADASIVCLYLTADGCNMMYVSFFSALSHTVLMCTGVKMSAATKRMEQKSISSCVSGCIFFLMALHKLFSA